MPGKLRKAPSRADATARNSLNIHLGAGSLRKKRQITVACYHKRLKKGTRPILHFLPLLSGIHDFDEVFFRVDIQLRQNLKYYIAVRVELRESIFPLWLHLDATATRKKTHLVDSPCFSMNSVAFSENVS